jgi:surface protein
LTFITPNPLDSIIGTPPKPFISVWNTNNTSVGSSNNLRITLPLIASGTFNFTVDWGDGSQSTVTAWNSPNKTHTYISQGIYTLTISGTLNGFSFNGSGDKLKILEITQWGMLRLGDFGYQFFGASNLTITATDVLNLEGITNLTQAFASCSSLTTVPNMNLWDTSAVTNMQGMFSGASSFNQDISHWNTSQVTNMSSMFYDALSFNQNLSQWNTSHVTTMYNMFYNANAFNQDISQWDTSQVTSMNGMFSQASSFNGAVSNWNTGNVTDMSFMFYNALAFNQDIHNWYLLSYLIADISDIFVGMIKICNDI